MKTVDAKGMGRTTFEQVLSFGQWPYGNKRVIVLSSKNIALPNSLRESITIRAETVKNLYDRLVHESVHLSMLMAALPFNPLCEKILWMKSFSLLFQWF